jgi:hypothetical protein
MDDGVFQGMPPRRSILEKDYGTIKKSICRILLALSK